MRLLKRLVTQIVILSYVAVKHQTTALADVAAIKADLNKSGLEETLMIDFSHANSEKKFENQMKVCTDVCGQIAGGDKAISGVMVESHIVEGRQDLVDGAAATYGQSITDACIGWADTETLLAQLSDAVTTRRGLICNYSRRCHLRLCLR